MIYDGREESESECATHYTTAPHTWIIVLSKYVSKFIMLDSKLYTALSTISHRAPQFPSLKTKTSSKQF